MQSYEISPKYKRVQAERWDFNNPNSDYVVKRGDTYFFKDNLGALHSIYHGDYIVMDDEFHTEVVDPVTFNKRYVPVA